MAAVNVTKGSRWIGGNPKRPGKPFMVLGWWRKDWPQWSRRKSPPKGFTHALVAPLEQFGTGARERVTKIERFQGGINGYVPYVEDSK